MKTGAKTVKNKESVFKKKVLHIGGANNPIHQTLATEEWQEVRMDNRAEVNPDILADMPDMSIINADEYDAVYSVGILSRYFSHQVPHALKEVFRILKPGGCAVLIVPDIQKIARSIINNGLEQPLYTSPLGPVSAIDLLYGFRPLMQHNTSDAPRIAFTAQTLAIRLQEAGFRSVEIKRQEFSLVAISHKLPQNTPPKIKIEEDEVYKSMTARDNIDKDPEIPVILK